MQALDIGCDTSCFIHTKADLLSKSMCWNRTPLDTPAYAMSRTNVSACAPYMHWCRTSARGAQSNIVRLQLQEVQTVGLEPD